jgi:hypothetical protein
VLVTERTSAAGKPQEASDMAVRENASQSKMRFMAAKMRRRAGESSGR